MNQLLRDFWAMMAAHKTDERSRRYESLQVMWQQHARAAEELYAAIYRTVEGALGRPLPPGTTPLEAVKQLAEELDKLNALKTALEFGPTQVVTRTEFIDCSGPMARRVKVIDDDGQIE